MTPNDHDEITTLRTRLAQAEASLQAIDRATTLDRAIVAASPDAIFGVTRAGLIESWNPAATRLYGHRAEEAIGRDVDLLIPSDRRPEVEAWRARLRLGERLQCQTACRTRSGELVDVDLDLAPIAATDGTVERIVVTARDARARLQAELHGKFLFSEINHRAKNILAVVQSIAHQTARLSDPRAFAERFTRRIAALAASHDLLARANWTGLEIAQLAASQLGHHIGEDDGRIVLSGRRVMLTPPAAEAIGMALHELAANAVTHGALSADTGGVVIAWAVTDAEFVLSWTEHDGPPVAPPPRRGFGLAVMVRLIEGVLRGKVRLDFAPTGLRWEVTAPADLVVDRGDRPADPA